MSEPEKPGFRRKLEGLSKRFRNPKDRKTQINIWYVVLALLGFTLAQSFYQTRKQYTTIPYSQFQTLLDQDKIGQVWIEQNTIQGTLKEPEKDGLKQFVTTRVTPDLATVLDKHHVTYSGEIPSTWLTDILPWVLPAVIFFGLWMFVIRRFGQGAGGLMAIGKSRAKIYVENDTKVAFELDALGGARGAFAYGGNSEKEQTLNQLLVEMDGFDPTIGVILLAATNRPEILDPALLRAGRFDRQILVDRPDKKDRIAILNVHLKKAVLANDFDSEQVAELTPGFTGADLANLVNEAALLATRRGADSVHLTDFNNAVERIVAGLEKKNRLLIPKERRIVAFHELGHAIVAMSLPGQDPVHKISIIPRVIGALGYTIQRPTEDRFLMTKEELENRMAVLLGGRAAEYIFFQHLSTGAADDLVKATDTARSMVLRYGMDKDLGHVAYERERPPMLGPSMPQGWHAREFSDETERDHAVRDLVGHAFDRAIDILNAHRAVHEKSAQLLLQQETLEEKDIAALHAQIMPAVGANGGDTS